MDQYLPIETHKGVFELVEVKFFPEKSTEISDQTCSSEKKQPSVEHSSCDIKKVQ